MSKKIKNAEPKYKYIHIDCLDYDDNIPLENFIEDLIKIKNSHDSRKLTISLVGQHCDTAFLEVNEKIDTSSNEYQTYVQLKNKYERH